MFNCGTFVMTLWSKKRNSVPKNYGSVKNLISGAFVTNIYLVFWSLMAWLAFVLFLLHICRAEASTNPGFNRSFVTKCGEEPRMNGLWHIFDIFFFLQRCSVTMFVYTAPRRNPVSGFISVSHRVELLHDVCVWFHRETGPCRVFIDSSCDN